MKYSIQKLGCEDINRFRELIACFGQEFEDPETYLSNPPSDEYLKDLLDSPTFIALTALLDGEVIGGLVAYELKKFEQARSEIYIYDLAVSYAHRRRGIATALIEWLKELAPHKQAWVIYVQADYGDEPATSLYRKMGIEERVLHFDIAPASQNAT